MQYALSQFVLRLQIADNYEKEGRLSSVKLIASEFMFALEGTMDIKPERADYLRAHLERTFLDSVSGNRRTRGGLCRYALSGQFPGQSSVARDCSRRRNLAVSFVLGRVECRQAACLYGHSQVQ